MKIDWLVKAMMKTIHSRKPTWIALMNNCVLQFGTNLYQENSP